MIIIKSQSYTLAAFESLQNIFATLRQCLKLSEHVEISGISRKIFGKCRDGNLTFDLGKLGRYTVGSYCFAAFNSLLTQYCSR